MDKINTWLNLGANLGVIASIIFLAFQIKQNTSQMQTEASFSINQTLHELNSAIYQDSSFAELYLRGCDSYSNLTEIEKLRFSRYGFEMLNLYIYSNTLKQQELQEIHTDVSRVIAERFQKNPGLMEFLKSIKNEWAASDELYQKLIGIGNE